MKGIDKNPASEVGAPGNLSDPAGQDVGGTAICLPRVRSPQLRPDLQSLSSHTCGDCPFKVLTAVVSAVRWAGPQGGRLSFVLSKLPF